MSHPGNDFIIDLARDEMEDEGTRIPSQHLEKIELERLFEEAVAGIILLRDAVDDAISVLDRNDDSKQTLVTLRELRELKERLKNIRKTMEESK